MTNDVNEGVPTKVLLHPDCPELALLCYSSVQEFNEDVLYQPGSPSNQKAGLWDIPGVYVRETEDKGVDRKSD